MSLSKYSRCGIKPCFAELQITFVIRPSVFFCVFFANTDDNKVVCHGLSKPGKRSFGRFSRPLLEVLFQTSCRYETKVKSLAIAEIFRYCKGFRLSYSSFCLLDQKYKRGVMRAIFRDKAMLVSKAAKWKSIRLGTECAFFSGGTPKSTDSRYYGGTIPFIRSGEIHGEQTELFLTSEGLKNSSAKMVSKGDLILALYGATSGEVDISRIDGAINQAILCIRPAEINRIFLKYLLEDSKDDILNTYLQGGQGNLSAEIIKSLVVDVPDGQSQQGVVDFLSEIDQRINNSLTCIETLMKLRGGLMQQLFI